MTSRRNLLKGVLGGAAVAATTTPNQLLGAMSPLSAASSPVYTTVSSEVAATLNLNPVQVKFIKAMLKDNLEGMEEDVENEDTTKEEFEAEKRVIEGILKKLKEGSVNLSSEELRSVDAAIGGIDPKHVDMYNEDAGTDLTPDDLKQLQFQVSPQFPDESLTGLEAPEESYAGEQPEQSNVPLRGLTPHNAPEAPEIGVTMNDAPEPPRAPQLTSESTNDVDMANQRLLGHDEGEEHVRGLDQDFQDAERLEHPTVLYRNMPAAHLGDEELTGQHLYDRRFLKASDKPDDSEEGNEPRARLRIRLPAGTPVVKQGDRYIVNRGARLQVTSHQRHGNVHHIDAELIGHE